MADSVAGPMVSVVIPTYRSGPGLDRVIASLDAQSLPQDQIEVLLLDDGSPDDTAQRSEAIAAERENYRAFALEASGWPSRPRNVGVREARGRWVLFMDHDDELFPDALRDAVAFGDAAAADVVNPKEVRTQVPRWGLGQYVADLGDASAQPLRGLLPMTPHKLYRREFLLSKDVRFPEAPRHLWEDIFFQIDLLEHDPAVALLSSTPFYHWRHTGENNSTSADGGRDYRGTPDYWPYLDKLFARIARVADPGLRTALLAHTVRVRVISEIGHRSGERSAADVAHDRAQVARLLADYVPVEVDRELSDRGHVALTLFRAGHLDAAEEFLRDGRDRQADCTVTHLEADGDEVILRGTVTWARDAELPFARRGTDGNLERGHSPHLKALLERLGLPTTPDLSDAEVALAVRHGSSRVNWLLPTTSTVTLTEQPDGTFEPVGTFEARCDPFTAAMGSPLGRGKSLVLGLTELEDRSGTRRVFSEVPADTAIGPVITATGVTGGLVLRFPPDAQPTRESGTATASREAKGWRRILGR